MVQRVTFNWQVIIISQNIGIFLWIPKLDTGDVSKAVLYRVHFILGCTYKQLSAHLYSKRLMLDTAGE